MFRSKPSSARRSAAGSRLPALSAQRNADGRELTAPEARHRACWYSRRTFDIPPDIGLHTIEDGQLLFCAHPMWFPVVGFQFDVRSCASCDYFKPLRAKIS